MLLEKDEYIDKLESENAYLKSQLVHKKTSNHNKLRSSLSTCEGKKTQNKVIGASLPLLLGKTNWNDERR